MWSKAQTADDFAAPNKDMLTFDALFKRAELAKAFSLDSSQVRKDAKRVKKRLHDANRFLLNPESRLMQLWDLTTVAALLFTLLVSPYEIGFLEDHEGDMPVLQIINILVNVTFGVDLFLNFFRPYRDALSQKVKSHARIAKNYLRSWFVIDLMSTVPFDLLATAMFPADEDGSSEVQTQFKLVRLMRLMKLFRIVRASRVFARWADRIEHYVSVSHSTRTLLWWMFMLLTTIHWFCCMWGLVAQIHGTQRTDALKAAVALDPACASVGCAAGDDSKSFQCADACLSSCELQVLAAMNGWSVEATLAQENWICRKLATGEFVREGPTAPPPAFVSYISVAAGFGQLTPLNTGEYCVAYFIAFVWLMMQNVSEPRTRRRALAPPPRRRATAPPRTRAPAHSRTRALAHSRTRVARTRTHPHTRAPATLQESHAPVAAPMRTCGVGVLTVRAPRAGTRGSCGLMRWRCGGAGLHRHPLWHHRRRRPPRQGVQAANGRAQLLPARYGCPARAGAAGT